MISEQQMEFLTRTAMNPWTGKAITRGYIVGYGIGYHHGRALGDTDGLRDELVDMFGISDEINSDIYDGSERGYSDGMDDYMTRGES